MTISVAIVTFNEEKYILRCLESVSWADEIILVDGQSQDRTAVIAKNFGAKVFVVPNQKLMKINMNLAFGKCRGDWILSLDADEKVTPDLKNEILSLLLNPEFSAYKIPRKNIIFNKWIAHTGWYPDFQWRLFQKGKARFPEKNVHEELEVNGKVGELKNHIEHLNYDTISQFISKMDSYTNYEAEKLHSEGVKVSWEDAIKFPFHEFLRRFFAWEGYKDGLHGLVLSLLMASYWEIIFAKLWERQGFPEHNNSNFLEDVNKVNNNLFHEYNHWLTANTSNRIIKIGRKIKNKFPRVHYKNK